MYIYKIGVVGAGKMGAEIAQVVTYAGLPVVLKDVNEELVEQGVGMVRSIYERRVERGKMSPGDMKERMKLIRGTTGYEEFSDVDLVVEAIPEDIELKKQVFQELEAACPEATILASNTSSLSISEIGGATGKPERTIGMHFFYPAHVMKLVEIIPGLDTDEETVETIVSFSQDLRKIPVRVKECPGFLVNRLLMPYLNEAISCLQEGAATTEEIDVAATEFGFPMGPFTLLDNIGIDIAHSVARVLFDAFGHRMPPAPLLEAVFEAGRYGRRTGAGFYSYGKADEDWLEKQIARIQKQTGVSGTDFSVERLLYPMVNEAALCLEEEVATPSDIERALLAGIGFPREVGGVLHYADQQGLDQVVDGLDRWKETLGPRFWPAPLLKRMVGAGHLGVKTDRGFFEYI